MSALAQEGCSLELFFRGDACPVYAGILAEPWFPEAVAAARERGIEVVTGNSPTRDGTPTTIINEAVALGRGRYLMFMANDDALLPGHVARRFRFAAERDLVMVYGDSRIDAGPVTYQRHARIEYGCIGHAEIAVRMDVARRVPPHHRGYGHDWDFIRSVLEVAPPDRVAHDPGPPTYIVNMGPREHTYQEGTL